MSITEIQAKSILRKQKKIESWFVSRYGMNLYRGCTHNCSYCDGRAEKYQVQGDFGTDVAVKVNALQLLSRELDPLRKRKPMPKGFIVVGGGVCDSYQSVEAKYHLTRRALELLAHYDFPIHMLTKSTLIEDDFDLLYRINEKSRAIISMSFSSVDDKISRHFEPGVPPPSRRLKTLEKFKRSDFAIGMYLMPVLPFITDTAEKMLETVSAAVNIGIDFIIFGGMTMKSGRQQDHFVKILADYDKRLVSQFIRLYSGDQWGRARLDYYTSVTRSFSTFAKKYNIPLRIPPALWTPFVDSTDRIIIILEHIDYLLKIENKKSSFGFAAYTISQLKEPAAALLQKSDGIGGISPAVARLIREILLSGSSQYYEWLLLGKKPRQ